MNRFIAWALMLPIFSGFMIAFGAAPGMALVPSCTLERRAVAHFQTVGGENVLYYTGVRALQCQVGSSHWVKGPQTWTVGYDTEHVNHSCGISDSFEGVVFNNYYWDGRGHNVNPGPVILRCQHDGTDRHTFYLDSAQQARFVKCASGVPQGKSSVKIVRGLGYRDVHATLQHDMWWSPQPLAPSLC